MANPSQRPLAQFTDEEILLVAMALNRGAKVEALELKDDNSAAILTDLLEFVIDSELIVRRMNPRRMAQELFDRILKVVQDAKH